MKGYKTFLIIFSVLFALYVIAEVNKPKAIDWRVTLSRNDKNPYGSYVLYQQLKDLFPGAAIRSYTLPVYNQVNNYHGDHSAYLIVAEHFNPSNNDWEELRNYIAEGNYVFLASSSFNKLISDSLKLDVKQTFTLLNEDSSAVNFVSPSLKKYGNYIFRRQTIDEYFLKIDTPRTTVLGIKNNGKPNFVKMNFGKGALFVHVNPLCFSNYFLLFKDNADYTAKALSFIPANIEKIYWDEFYKGGETAGTPLRFFLSNEFLRWALRLSLIGLILFVLFEMKRRQRIIPVITPLKNTTLDFVKTVARVYFNQKDNESIAHKKISYFLDFTRQKFFLSATFNDENFAMQLAGKSGVEREKVDSIINLIQYVQSNNRVTDDVLLNLNTQIDSFYKQVK